MIGWPHYGCQGEVGTCELGECSHKVILHCETFLQTNILSNYANVTLAQGWIECWFIKMSHFVL